MGRKNKNKGKKAASKKSTNLVVPQPTHVVQPFPSDDGSQSTLITQPSPLDDGPQPSPSIERLVLSCQHPNDVERALFDIEKRKRTHGDYKIEGKNTLEQLYSVKKLGEGGGKKYMLKSSSYLCNITEVFEKRTTVDGEEDAFIARKFTTSNGINILDEDVRTIIQSLLLKIFKLHDSGRFHGSLDRGSNIVVERFVRPERSTFKVSIIYKDMESSKNIKNALDGMRKDFKDVSKVIFVEILPQSFVARGDWKQLNSTLNSFYNSQKVKRSKLDSVFSTTWSWERKLEFFEIMHAEIKKRFTGFAYRNAVNNLNKYYDWHLDIVANSPLEKLYHAKYYGNDPSRLVRFLRDVPFHINDKKGQGTGTAPYYDRMTESDWGCKWYLEEQISKLWPTLIGDIIEELGASLLDTKFTWQSSRE